ncbi:hypothetical protein [Candidatus Rariloculus sp.]|uniref:hypothetical protein n=1 Tax=Candidatus Rariloculus sp. TaxID=3101265 RepID=UPI003D0C50C3
MYRAIPFGHRHLLEALDLATCVRMANAAVGVLHRSVDYFHMPVPKDHNDDEFFAALRQLETGEARVFLGLVHHTDGLDGTIGRITTASKYIGDFGISTECGFGRRPVS